MHRPTLSKLASAAIVLAMAHGVGVFVRASGGAINLAPFGTAFNHPVGIDYYEPLNRLVLSVFYFSGLPHNLELVAADGTNAAFSGLSGEQDEMKIASVRSGPCTGGFQVGDIFVGTTLPAQIALVRNGVVFANPWIVLPGEQTDIRGSLFQDRFCAFGGDLIVVTGISQPSWQVDRNGHMGKVWRVSCGPVPDCSAPVATLVVDLQKHLEGVVTVPNDPVRYGPIAGRILVGDEDRTFGPHGPCGRIFAVRSANDIFTISHGPEATHPDCVTKGNDKISYAAYPNYHVSSPIHPEDLDWIPKANPNPNVNGDGAFFGVDYAGGRILTAPLSDFADYCGDLLITREYPNDGFSPGTSGLSTLRWNASTQSFDHSLLTTPANASSVQWEHVTFRGGSDCKTCTGVIGDFVWKDLNGNGARDPGEPGIPNVTVTLTMPSVPAWQLSVMTDATGHYTFAGLCAGTYTVTVTPPPSDTFSTPNPKTITLEGDSASALSADFGLKGPGIIGNFTWKDLNCNGIQDAGEPHLAGVTLHLKMGLNSVGPDIASTVSDANGLYQFKNLNPGDYTVKADLPGGGYSASPSNAGGNAALDSNFSPSNVTFSLAQPVDNTVDFGDRLPPALTITKTADVPIVAGGTPIGFTITVSNSGGTAQSVTLSDPLPAGTGVSWGIMPAYAGPGGCGIGGLPPAQSLSCSFGDMANNASASVHIQSNTSAASAGTYLNTATAKALNHGDRTASATIQVTAPLPPQAPAACTLGYTSPTTGFPRTGVVFNENEVLAALARRVSGGYDTINVFANDEHALTLGVRQVVVKNPNGTFNQAVETMSGNPSSKTGNPLAVGFTAQTGDVAGIDLAGRPMFPALFITDITGLTDSPSSPNGAAYKAIRANDWQFGGTALLPHAIFGTWKAAVRTVDKTKNPALITVTPDASPAKNNWSGIPNPFPGPTPKSLGYGTEIRWEVSKLGLTHGRNYRLQVMVHDGDQNKTGGDVGQACLNIAY